MILGKDKYHICWIVSSSETNFNDRNIYLQKRKRKTESLTQKHSEAIKINCLRGLRYKKKQFDTKHRLLQKDHINV
jgi:hypothetical protein